MQLDQQPPSGKATEPVIDLTTDPPTASSDNGARPGSPTAAPSRSFGLAAAVEKVIGGNSPIGIECYDGSRTGPADACTVLIVRSPKALQYAVTAPGELGIARAYVSGELDLRGDI